MSFARLQADYWIKSYENSGATFIGGREKNRANTYCLDFVLDCNSWRHLVTMRLNLTLWNRKFIDLVHNCSFKNNYSMNWILFLIWFFFGIRSIFKLDHIFIFHTQILTPFILIHGKLCSNLRNKHFLDALQPKEYQLKHNVALIMFY